ncbi:LysM peptidoglycan-binding domain-containing protein [Streptomyces sp. NPDC098789]|uniref:LysM peptidoglycan-binding domain-containing protein n=1 Tax=Streptomyces sp. NPDC098789 TaxID=3366098 RepID=UPI003808A488
MCQKEAFRVYTVRAGDSLHSVATKELGNMNLWASIYASNRRAIGKFLFTLKAGQEILLPMPTA